MQHARSINVQDGVEAVPVPVEEILGNLTVLEKHDHDH